MRILIAVLCSFLMVGCGFKLRGIDTQLSDRFAQTYVSSGDSLESDFSRKIKQLIHVNGGQVVAREFAQLKVHVTPVKVYSRQIALSDSGAIKEFERTYSTVVTLVDLSNGIQLGSRQISTTRFIQLDDRRVLAGEEQSEVTENNAENALAQSVIRYLESF